MEAKKLTEMPLASVILFFALNVSYFFLFPPSILNIFSFFSLHFLKCFPHPETFLVVAKNPPIHGSISHFYEQWNPF